MAPHLVLGVLSSMFPLLLLAISCSHFGPSTNAENRETLASQLECEGQKCYAKLEDIKLGDSSYNRDCISGVEVKDGCVKLIGAGYTVSRCYCSGSDFCNSQVPTSDGDYPILNATALLCARENGQTCSSYECLYVGNTRQCQESVDEYTPQSDWFGYLWQNTCLHHRTQSGKVETDCRCNTNNCNEKLPELSYDMATNETYRTSALIKCHFSFEAGGVASDKYFCIGELCALSDEKGVRTCVNITYRENAEPMGKPGLIDFDNRTYYLCDKPLCNWNASVALASLNATWQTRSNATLLVPFEQSSSSFSLTLIIAIVLMSWIHVV